MPQPNTDTADLKVGDYFVSPPHDHPYRVTDAGFGGVTGQRVCLHSTAPLYVTAEGKVTKLTRNEADKYGCKP